MFDDDLEIDQETINNNVKKAIDRMDADDLDLDKMMNFSDSNSNLDRHDVNTDDHDVNRHDVKWSDESDVTGNDVSVPEKKTKLKACGCGFKINEAYLDKFREEREKRMPGGPCDYLYKSPLLDSNTSEYISDNASDPQESNYETAEGDAGLTSKPLQEGDAEVTSKPLDTVLWSWRIASQSEPIDNKGHGKHKKMLEEMSIGPEKDKKLLSVLHSFMKSASSIESYFETKDEHDEMSESSDGGESVEKRVENDEFNMYAGPNDVQQGMEIEISTECEPCKDVEGSEDGNDRCDVRGTVGKGDEGMTEKDHGYALKDDVIVKGIDSNKVIDIIPENTAELTDVVNLSGHCVYNPETGEVCNIDNINISQFTQIYLVNTPVLDNMTANQVTNYTLSVVVKSDDEPIKVKQEEEDTDTKGKGEKGEESEINVNDEKEKDVVEAAGDESQCDVKHVKELEAASDDKSDESQHDVNDAEKEDGKEIEGRTKSDENQCDVKDAEMKEMDLVIGNSKSDENKSGIEHDENDAEEVEVLSNSKSDETESEINIIDVNEDGSKENSYGEVENMSEEIEVQSVTSTDQSSAKSDTSCSFKSTGETSHGNGSGCSE